MTELKIIENLPTEGVYLENTLEPGSLDSEILNAKAIILDFPTFMDGRAFSQARQLRRLGFKGELIASGDIRADQGRQYGQVGISTLHFKEGFDRQTLQNNLKMYSQSYQHSFLSEKVIYKKRLQDNQPHFSGGGPF